MLFVWQYHGNPNQLCFLVKRVEGEDSDRLTQFLKNQVSLEDIRKTERIFGHGWFSSGGEYTTRVGSLFVPLSALGLPLLRRLIRRCTVNDN